MDQSNSAAVQKRKVISPRKTLLIKLLVAFVVPTASFFSLFAFFAYEVQREDLEEELGRRLEDVASIASTRLRGKFLLDLRAGDEEESLYYSSGLGRLNQIREATGVDRLYVFDREFATRLDTAGAGIGERQFQAEIDRQELAELFLKGETTSSALFDGLDGRPYKAGYAAIFRSGKKEKVVLVVGVDAPAEFFESLDALRKKLILYGIFLVLAVAAVAVLLGMRITRPIRSLAEAAERIGAGDLGQPIVATSKDEIGLLANTMETMRSDLRNRDERMQLMLAGIAHEVRNPLGGMELFAGILREELEDDEEKRSHVARIEKEISHLKTVVESFLDYARRPDPSLSPVALHSLLAEVADLEGSLLRDLSVELELDLQPVYGLADAEQLRRALLNLLRNAIQAASGSKKAVTLKLWREGENAIFSIQNFGAGIDKEAHEHLFEPFYTTKEKGTGLGLAFVHEIITDHEGTISVTSSDSEGTCFTIAIAAHDVPSEGQSTPEAEI